jgi:malate dehydrogenase
MARTKVTVIGAGNVGATLVQRLAEMEVANEVVVVDIPATEGMPAGKALDLLESGPVLGYDTRIIGTTSYEPTAGSDVVIITAGIPRKPGMSRDDLLNTNAKIVAAVTESVVKFSPNCILIIVSNPLDAMCQVALKVSKFPKHRVIGMAGVLDSARMRWFIAEALDVSMESVHAMVLGGHGDTMVPMPRFSTVSGIAITELLSKEKIDAINQRTRDGGAEIVKLLKTGSAYYAPSASAAEMVESSRLANILPSTALLEGEYGVRRGHMGCRACSGRTAREDREARATPRRKAVKVSSAAVAVSSGHEEQMAGARISDSPAGQRSSRGASSGIANVAEALAARARTSPCSRAVATSWNEPRLGALAVRGDVAVPADLERLVDAPSPPSRRRHLVNNGGGPRPATGVYRTIESAVALLLNSAVRLTALCLPHLEQSSGHIINLPRRRCASRSTTWRFQTSSAPASSAGPRHLAEVGPKGITVNTIATGRSRPTACAASSARRTPDKLAGTIPARHIGRPDGSPTSSASRLRPRLVHLGNRDPGRRRPGPHLL